MSLDPQVRAVLDQISAIGAPPINELSVSDARQSFTATKAMQGEPEEVAMVENFTLPGTAGGIPVRVYNPAGKGTLPIFVYFHGGGWVVGDIESSDVLCRALCNAAGCIVVSVDYRLAPEHPFPAAVDDAYDATSWISQNAATLRGDPSRIAIGGDSAGGNLAAVVAQVARDRGRPALRFQLLIYPVTDAACDTQSYDENAEGYLLTKDAMKWFWNHYARSDADRRNPLASPLRAADLTRLPPALVITAEFDPLRDEGERYADRLRAAGVRVELARYDGMIHGFFAMGSTIDQGKNALRHAAAALSEAFAL